MVNIKASKKFKNIWTARNENGDVIAFCGNANDLIELGAIKGKKTMGAPWLILYVTGDIAHIDYGFTVDEYVAMSKTVINAWTM